MRVGRRWTGGPTAALGLLVCGCLGSEPIGEAIDEPEPTAAPVETPTLAPTFGAIYTEVFRTSNCTLGLCHGEGARGGALDLTPRQEAFDHLVGVASGGVACAALGYSLVEPGHPDESLLWLKLSADPPCGRPMPPDGPLSEEQRDQIRRWIELGAPND